MDKYSIDDIKEFYNDTAQKWYENWIDDDALLPLLKHFIGKLPVSPRVLDVGCGCGYESKRLHELGAKVTGIDCSENSIEIAKEKIDGCTFICDDFLNISSNTGEFDGIVAVAFIVHIDINNLDIVIKK